MKTASTTGAPLPTEEASRRSVLVRRVAPIAYIGFTVVCVGVVTAILVDQYVATRPPRVGTSASRTGPGVTLNPITAPPAVLPPQPAPALSQPSAAQSASPDTPPASAKPAPVPPDAHRAQSEQTRAEREKAEATTREAERQRIERAKLETAANEAERQRIAKERLLDDLIAKSGGKLAEIGPLENLTGIKVPPGTLTALLSEILVTQCHSAVIDPTQVKSADLVARGGEVKVVRVKLLTATVRTPPPSFGDGTPIKSVEMTALVAVYRISDNTQLWTKELSGRKNSFASEVQGQSDGALVGSLLTKSIRDLQHDRAFKKAVSGE